MSNTSDTTSGATSRRVKVVLFDLWKTLARGPYPEPIGFLRTLLGLAGKVTDEEFLLACLTTSPEDPATYLFEVARRFGVTTVPEGAVEDFAELIQNEKNGLSLFTDVGSELRAIQALGYRIGLVTNCWPFPLRTLLATPELEGMFEHVISSHAVGIAKQDGPEIYHIAAMRFGVHPDECLMIGDNPKLDIIPAQAANVQTLLIDRDGSYVDRDGHFKNAALREQLRVGVVRTLKELREHHLAGGH